MAFVRPRSFFPDVKIDPTCEIRVVAILPGVYQDPLRCQLQVQRLDEPGAQEPNERHFECLSYTWGSWVNSQTIELNNIPGFPVTENLWHALRRMRMEKQARRFWIDQISLNQQDNKEKEKQLPRMGDIYQLATNVIVWIGDAPDFASEEDEVEKRYRQLEHALSHQNPPWYNRAWVIQEYVRASNPPVFCFGSSQVEGMDLGSGKTTWKALKRLFFSYGPLHFHSRLHALDMMRKDSELLNLCSLACLMQHVDCTVPKDNVFSLYSILPLEERSMITVDYERTDAAVFSEATYASIACSRSLAILRLVSNDRGSRPLELPSWAVNFNRRIEGRNAPIVDTSSSSLVRKLLMLPLIKVGEKMNIDIWGPALLMGYQMPQMDAQHRWAETQPHVPVTPTYHTQDGKLEVHGLRFGRIIDCTFLSDSHARVDHNKLDDGSREATTSKWIIQHLLSATPKPYELLQNPKSTLLSLIDQSKPKTALRDIMTTYVYEAWHAAFLQQHNIPKADPPNHTHERWKQAKLMEPGGTTLVITEHGFLGCGTRKLQQDDLIVLPFGSSTPIVLRPVKEQNTMVFSFQGIISVYGIMEDELNKIVPGLKLKDESFVLV